MSGINTSSDTWLETVAWAEERLKTARKTLEAPNCDPRQADHLRGQITAIKELLNLPNKKNEPDITGSKKYL